MSTSERGLLVRVDIRGNVHVSPERPLKEQKERFASYPQQHGYRRTRSDTESLNLILVDGERRTLLARAVTLPAVPKLGSGYDYEELDLPIWERLLVELDVEGIAPEDSDKVLRKLANTYSTAPLPDDMESWQWDMRLLSEMVTLLESDQNSDTSGTLAVGEGLLIAHIRSLLEHRRTHQ